LLQCLLYAKRFLCLFDPEKRVMDHMTLIAGMIEPHLFFFQVLRVTDHLD
jgi:hypothetical protein